MHNLSKINYSNSLQNTSYYIRYQICCKANRLSSTIGSNREMDRLYTPSTVSNTTIGQRCHVFQDEIKKCKIRK